MRLGCVMVPRSQGARPGCSPGGAVRATLGWTPLPLAGEPRSAPRSGFAGGRVLQGAGGWWDQRVGLPRRCPGGTARGFAQHRALPDGVPRDALLCRCLERWDGGESSCILPQWLCHCSPARDSLGPVDATGPTAVEPGSALAGLGRGPYLLPPPWELATRSAPVNFLFLFLFLSC